MYLMPALGCLVLVLTASRHLQATRTTVRVELPGSHERPPSLLVLRLDSVAMTGNTRAALLSGLVLRLFSVSTTVELQTSVLPNGAEVALCCHGRYTTSSTTPLQYDPALFWAVLGQSAAAAGPLVFLPLPLHCAFGCCT